MKLVVLVLLQFSFLAGAKAEAADGALGGACLPSSACTDTAKDTCDAAVSQCRRKIGQACVTASSMAECVSTAAACPASGGTLTCACPATATVNAGNTVCLMHIGQTCGVPTDCYVSGATCTGTPGVCTCPAGKGPTADKKQCLKLVGQDCTVQADCLDSQSTCTGSPTKCTCPSTRVPKSDNTACLLKIGETCSAASTTDCLENTKECPSDTLKCTCKYGYTSSDDKTKCSGASLCVTGSLFLLLVTVLISRLT